MGWNARGPVRRAGGSSGERIFQFWRWTPIKKESMVWQFPRAMNCSYLVPLAVLISAVAWAADDLPTKAPGETLDFEPKLMLNDVPLGLPSTTTPATPEEATPATDADVKRLEGQVERAKKTAAWRERLFRQGIFSKVQAEQSALTVVRLIKDLECARRDVARDGAAALQKRADGGEAVREELEKANTALAACETCAKDASDHWEKAQFDSAQLNLQRQRKLFAVGATTKNQLRRAEEKMASMKAPALPAVTGN